MDPMMDFTGHLLAMGVLANMVDPSVLVRLYSYSSVDSP
jgi:hypothetical protein